MIGSSCRSRGRANAIGIHRGDVSHGSKLSGRGWRRWAELRPARRRSGSYDCRGPEGRVGAIGAMQGGPGSIDPGGAMIEYEKTFRCDVDRGKSRLVVFSGPNHRARSARAFVRALRSVVDHRDPTLERAGHPDRVAQGFNPGGTMIEYEKTFRCDVDRGKSRLVVFRGPNHRASSARAFVRALHSAVDHRDPALERTGHPDRVAQGFNPGGTMIEYEKTFRCDVDRGKSRLVVFRGPTPRASSARALVRALHSAVDHRDPALERAGHRTRECQKGGTLY